jgi:putative sigma-54 modulation protein
MSNNSRASFIVAHLEDIADETTEFEIIKTKTVYLRPMTAEDAILQMNMLGHDFFMFKDAISGKISLVYKRKDEHYSVMIPE